MCDGSVDMSVYSPDITPPSDLSRAEPHTCNITSEGTVGDTSDDAGSPVLKCRACNRRKPTAKLRTVCKATQTCPKKRDKGRTLVASNVFVPLALPKSNKSAQTKDELHPEKSTQTTCDVDEGTISTSTTVSTVGKKKKRAKKKHGKSRKSAPQADNSAPRTEASSQSGLVLQAGTQNKGGGNHQQVSTKEKARGDKPNTIPPSNKRRSGKKRRKFKRRGKGLTPYQGKDRVFGQYQCTRCNVQWYSANSWADKSQTCKRCGVSVYPIHQWALEHPDGPKQHDTTKEHPQSLCEMCQDLGFPCKSLLDYPDL